MKGLNAKIDCCLLSSDRDCICVASTRSVVTYHFGFCHISARHFKHTHYMIYLLTAIG